MFSLLSLEEAEPAVDRHEVNGVAQHLDPARAELGKRRADVRDVHANVVIPLGAQAAVEGVNRRSRLSWEASEDLDLRSAVAEVGGCISPNGHS